MDDIEALFANYKIPYPPRGTNSAHTVADGMHPDARRLRAQCDGSITHCHQLYLVAALLESRHQQQRLLLAAAPYSFQIRE